MEHDLFGKPVSTFPDHALGRGKILGRVSGAEDARAGGRAIGEPGNADINEMLFPPARQEF
jgi:hypothetical protein